MTDTNKGKTKALGVYNICEFKVGDETKSEWLKVGIAWPHKSGKGFNIDLYANPVDGRLTVYPMPEKKAETEQPVG